MVGRPLFRWRQLGQMADGQSSQLVFGLEPVVEVVAGLGTAGQIDFTGPVGDFGIGRVAGNGFVWWRFHAWKLLISEPALASRERARLSSVVLNTTAMALSLSGEV